MRSKQINQSVLTFLAFVLLGLTPILSQKSKPNILLIIADDMGIDVTNGYQQNPVMPTTPHLDALRANDITYMNAWSSPTCTPTRASIMSGKYGVKTGVMSVPDNLDLTHTSLFKRLRDLNADTYAQAVIGKWHISNPVNANHPMEHGVDHFEGILRGGVTDYYQWEKVTNGVASQENDYVTSHFTDAAIDWVADQAKPWFLWLAHVAPHDPFHIPPDGLYSIDNTNGDLNKYVAAIEAMDHEIGRLLESLDTTTLENTVIIFIGDNGTPRSVIQNFEGDHGKGTLYEGGIHVPMIVSGKGVSRMGEEEEGLTHVSDIHATVVELTGNQLQGGILNSLSLKPSFSCDGMIDRPFIYSDRENSNQGILFWTIRNDQYKLIEDENGNIEFYDVQNDVLEQNDLVGSLTNDQMMIFTDLQNEAYTIRDEWSCRDQIRNGEEKGIDDCEANCEADDSLSSTNIGCCDMPSEPSVYYEFEDGAERNIYSNNYPNHNFCYNPNNIPSQKYYNFKIDLKPTIAAEITSVLSDNGRPDRYFGVALNGCVMAPAPAAPFIFENPSTGEFNWDWVFEPTTNQGDGMGLVKLDCASAHTGPQGYHYHGEMFEYLETILPGVTMVSEVPEKPIHIGWAADGFPIVYKYGPDPDGNIKELLPSFQLKKGLRPGNGIQEPCGAYNGKYTLDFEYICGRGDLDGCNGIESSITIATAIGTETFEYFYVITSAFPQISRCLVGHVSEDFDNDAPDLRGMDNDGDGFIEAFDCDDNNAAINPAAVEIFGNDIDEDCNGITTSTSDVEIQGLNIGPNPSNGTVTIRKEDTQKMKVFVYTVDGRMIVSKKGGAQVILSGLETGAYIVKIIDTNHNTAVRKLVVE